MAVAASIAAAGCAGALGVAAGVACTMKEMLSLQTRGHLGVPAAAGASAPAVEDSHGWEGFTMEEARALADSRQEKSVVRSPAEVLGELQRGNARFWMGNASRPEKSAFERRALISKQFPSTAILSCADSRVPTEIVFDQGLGDMFVVRVAGNAVTQSTCASLQYAVHHLKVKVLIVMGHEACGAVKAAGLPSDALQKEPAELCTALHAIKAGLDFNRLGCIQDTRAHDREAVVANVKQQVQALTRDERIMTKVSAKELIIVGAFYEISSGIVDFFYEVNESTKLPSRGVQSVYDPQGSLERQASGVELSVKPQGNVKYNSSDKIKMIG